MMNFEQEVPMKDIEIGLSKILDDLQGKNKTRACLFNLLIYTKDNSRERYIQQVIQKIVTKFPCRVILFIEKEDKNFQIKSKISVLEIHGSNSPVFCDCIQFEISKSDLKLISFLSLPHLITDLPTYLLWTEDPYQQDPLIHNPESYCSRIIFD